MRGSFPAPEKASPAVSTATHNAGVAHATPLIDSPAAITVLVVAPEPPGSNSTARPIESTSTQYVESGHASAVGCAVSTRAAEMAPRFGVSLALVGLSENVTRSPPEEAITHSDADGQTTPTAESFSS